MSRGIELRRHAPRVCTWQLDAPARRNALHPDDLDWIRRASEALDHEVVVITGGPAVFCAGFDLEALAASADPTPDRSLIAATTAMSAARGVFIAALAGPVVGAGVELAVSCDFRIAARTAALQVPAGRLGVVYHAGGLARMRAVLGPAITRRLVLAGARVEAQALVAAGGVDELIDDPDEVHGRALTLAHEIAALAPLSVIGNRRLLAALDQGPPSREQLEAHEQARSRAYTSEDHAEARAAVRARRSPLFRGR